MADAIKLDGHHRVTLEKLFQHPVGHNIQWHDVLSLLEATATTVREHDGRYHVTLGSETETFDTPRVRLTLPDPGGHVSPSGWAPVGPMHAGRIGRH